MWQAWMVTGGSDSGIMKFVGQACAEESNDVPLIGIMPWGVVEGRQGLLSEPADLRVKPPADTFAPDYEQCLEIWRKQVERLQAERPGMSHPINGQHRC